MVCDWKRFVIADVASIPDGVHIRQTFFCYFETHILHSIEQVDHASDEVVEHQLTVGLDLFGQEWNFVYESHLLVAVSM